MAPAHGEEVYFDGTNLEDLARASSYAQLKCVLDKDLDLDQHGHVVLAMLLRGAAQDWFVANSLKPVAGRADVSSITKLENQLKAFFGITSEHIIMMQRQQLEQLKWTPSDPITFFADFERLSVSLGMLGDSSRLLALTPKMPTTIIQQIAALGLPGITYSTYRERVIAMTIMGARSGAGPNQKRVKCSNCGKRGHDAKVCRNPKEKV